MRLAVTFENGMVKAKATMTVLLKVADIERVLNSLPHLPPCLGEQGLRFTYELQTRTGVPDKTEIPVSYIQDGLVEAFLYKHRLIKGKVA